MFDKMIIKPLNGKTVRFDFDVDTFEYISLDSSGTKEKSTKHKISERHFLIVFVLSIFSMLTLITLLAWAVMPATHLDDEGKYKIMFSLVYLDE